MSQAAGVLDLTFKAGATLTDNQYHFVKLGADGVVACGVAKELSTGILQNTPADTKAARVRLLGTSKLVMGGTCSENALLATDINGHGVLASAEKDYVGAIALEASGGADEII
ncbi:unnamed protein product, partial [marine sediment metagenome]